MSFKYIKLPLSLLGVLLLLVVFFLPLFQGKMLLQSDTQGWKGMVQELKTFKKQTGEHSYWTGNLFSGMPTVNIDSNSRSNLFSYVEKALNFLPKSIWMLFLTFLGFFVLLRVLGVSHWLAMLGGVAYMFSSYFFIITAVGHVTKMHAISYFAFVVAGLLLTYKGKYWKGGLLFAVSLSLHILANHPQITYYLLLLVLLYGLFELVKTIREKTWRHFVKASSILVVGAVLAVATNAENLYKVYDSAKVSIRGEQILEQETTKGGVDLQYATEWSYGKDETLTLLIPNLKGGSSNGKALDKSSETYAVLQQMRVQQPAQVLKSLGTYWGTQRFTEGGVYVGALVFFLFLFGLLNVKGYLKWWLLSATILAIFLAWGRNFMGFYQFFYEYFPLFNKFRTPSMILVLAEFTMPLLAFYALDKVLKEKEFTNETQKNLLWSLGITLGICLVLWLFPTLLGDFSGARDGQLPEPLQNALIADRKALLRNDVFRSGVIVFLAAGVLWLALRDKLKQPLVLGVLALLVIVDMWGVNRRFIGEDNYVSKRRFEKIMPYKADMEILKDKDLSYRVLDITESPFNSSRASYFHKSIGGYHAAKLRRYQDLIEYHLQPELEKLVDSLKAQSPIDRALLQCPALRMLNLRYLLFSPDVMPFKTSSGLGNAWFVNKVKAVDTPKEEIKAIGTVDIVNTAIVLEKEQGSLAANEETKGEIAMTSYAPNHIVYESESNSGGLAVFSEIYHPDWKVKIDGKLAAIHRVNYALMALELPKGVHKIELLFQPEQYALWRWIGLIASIVLLLAIGWVVLRSYSKQKEA